jgi:hypothetical protein
MLDMSDKYSKEYIQNLLMRDDIIGMHAIGRGLIALNKRQTAAERATKEVLRDNARGFTPYDAQMGTDMANFYAQRNMLTKKQLDYWRKPNSQGIPRICKYWKQLVEIAREKHGVEASPKQKTRKSTLYDSRQNNLV